MGGRRLVVVLVVITSWSALGVIPASGGAPEAGVERCVGANPPASAAIPWENVRNPIFGFADAAVKDGPLILGPDGRWLLGYSRIAADPFRFRLGHATTTDFRTWDEDEPLDDPAVGGLASPEIVRRRDGTFVETFNSHTRDVQDSLNKLYYRTSDDLVEWSKPRRIHVKDHDEPSDRLIDAALAETDDGWYLGYKWFQSFRIAHAPSLRGPWREVGIPATGLLENYQFLRIDGVWHLVGTTWTPEGTTFVGGHRPVLFRMRGNPAKPKSWIQWEKVRELEMPGEAWNTGTGPENTYEIANAVYLCDARALDGYWYAVYSGSNEVITYEARGHAMVGIARSKDLVTWEVPPG